LQGRGAAAILTLASTAVMATVLSVQDFGMVVLMHTYVVVVRGLFQFKPFEPIVRFGVPFMEDGNQQSLSSLLCLTRIIDVTTSILATLSAILLVSVVSVYLEWDAALAEVAVLYSLVLLLTGTGTAKGVLRLHDRFDALSVQLVVAPVVRFTGVVTAAYFNSDREVFMLVWALALVSGNVYLMIRGHLELRRHKTNAIWSGQSLKSIFSVPGDFWHFSFVVYGQTQLDLINKNTNTLLVGFLLGPGAAGLFRVAKDFANILSTPAVLMRQVLFPELTRAWHTGQGDLKGKAYRISISAGLGGLLLVALSLPLGPYLLELIGDDYSVAALLLTLLLTSASLDLAAAPVRSAAYAVGKAGSVLKIHLLCMVLYLALFVLLAEPMGLTGPGIAGIFASACALVGMLYTIKGVPRTIR
jgi:O-antigen/teichoic acid export membrane protein